MSVPDLGAGSCWRDEKHRAADLLCPVPTRAMTPSSTGGGRRDSPRRDSAPSPGSEVWTPCGSGEGRVTVDGELPGAPLDPCHTPCAGPLAPQPASTPGLPQPCLGASGRPSPWAPHLQPCPAPKPPTRALPSPRLLVVCKRSRICSFWSLCCPQVPDFTRSTASPLRAVSSPGTPWGAPPAPRAGTHFL